MVGENVQYGLLGIERVYVVRTTMGHCLRWPVYVLAMRHSIRVPLDGMYGVVQG